MGSNFLRRIFLPLFAFLLIPIHPQPAWAGWSFTYQIYQSNCPTTVDVPLLPPIPAVIPTQSECEALRAQFLSIVSGFTWDACSDATYCPRYCEVGYTCGPCTGSDDAAIGGGGLIMPNGEAAGNPVFSRHSSTQNSDWYTQTLDRYNMVREAGGWYKMDGNSWFRGSWFEVPRQCLLRMPGATGPDADFYRTLTIVEYGNAEQKKAARSGAAAQPAPAKPKESAKEPPKESAEWKESEYFRKLQMRETGEGYMPTGGNLGKLTVPPPSSVPFKETGTELKTESGAMVELTEIAKGAYDKGVEMVADFVPDKLKDMGKEIGDSLFGDQFSKHEETYEAMKEGVDGTMGVIGEGCQMVINGNTNSEAYFSKVFDNGIGWMKTAFDRAKEHSTE